MAPVGVTVLGTVSKSDLTDEGAGLFTFTNNDGSDVQFDVRSVEVVFDAASNVYNFLDTAGAVIASIDMNASNVAFDNTTSGLTATNVQAALDELATQIGDLDLIDNLDGTFSLMAPDGVTVLGTVSKSDLTDEGAGLFTFTNNDGSDVQFDVRSVEVVFDAASNSYNFLDAAGAVIASIDMNASNVAFDNTTSGLTATDVQAALDELATQIGDLDLVDNLDGTFSLMAPDGITVLGTVSKSDLTDEGAGLFTFTNNDGSDVQFDVRSVEVVFDAASNVYNFLDSAGAVIASIDMNASNVAYNNTASGLTATNVQAAIDELIGLAGGLSDILVDNGDGTYTHTTVSGAVVTIDANTVSVTVVDGVYTFLDGDNQIITTIDTNADAIAYDNITSGLAATNVQAAIDELIGLAGGLSDILVDNGDGTYTHTTVSGAVVTIDANTVDVTVVDGVYTFLDGAGATITTIDTNADAIAYDNATSGLTATNVQAALDELANLANNLTDELIDNGDGTYTHIAVDNTPITFDTNRVNVTVSGGVYTFLDGQGNPITSIDTNANALPYDNTTSGLTATDVQTALDELATQIGDLDLIDNLDGTFSLMAPDGITVLGTVSKSDLTDEGAGLFTFTNNDGSDVQFDVRSVEVVFDAASNSYNFLDAAGAVIASIDMNASNVAFDNTTSGLTATDVQAALDELATQIGDLDLIDNLDGTFSLMAPDGITVLGTVSKSDLTDEGDGLFTFTNNDGSDVQFDVRSVEVVFDAASNSYNFLDAAGAVIASIDMNATAIAYDNATSGLAATDVQTALDELAN